MSSELPQAVLDAADVNAITQLVLTERESHDLARWERMRDCFHPDSVVRISWFSGSGYEFVERSIDMRSGIRHADGAGGAPTAPIPWSRWRDARSSHA